MTVILQDIINLTQNHISDHTDERISDIQMFDAITEACAETIELNKNAMSNMTFPLNFINGKHYYKIPAHLYSVFGATDLRVEVSDETGANRFVPFNRTSADKIVEDITLQRYNDTYALDRFDGDMYLAICYRNGNHSLDLIDPENNTGIAGSLDTIAIYYTNNLLSGAEHSVRMEVLPDTNLEGRMTINTLDNLGVVQDLSRFKDTGIVHVALSIDDAVDIESITLGLEDNSASLLTTVITQEDDIPFESGNNNLMFDFSTVLNKGGIDWTNIEYITLTVKYNSDKIDNFNVYVDSIKAHVPTKFRFHYLGYSVGRNVSGESISQFSHELDVPYFSGQYDNFKFVISRYAASYLLNDLRLDSESDRQRALGDIKMRSINNIIPSDHKPENKSFRPAGINFNRRRR